MKSLQLTLAGALAISTVFAHPLQHAEFHKKRQDAQTLVWVTLYQTQAAGPGGEPRVYTITSPMWVYASATGTGTDDVAAPTTAVFPTNTDDAVSVPDPTSIADDATTAIEPVSTTAAQSSAAKSSAAKSSAAKSSAAKSSTTEAPAVQSLGGQFAQKQVTKASTTTYSPPAASTPTQAAPSTGGGGGGGTVTGQYQKYSGKPADYPAKSSWISLEQLFESSKGSDSKGMAASKKVSLDQMNQLLAAVKTAGASIGVDPRIILAMIVQESHGEADQPEGLMQAGVECGTGWSQLASQITCSMKKYTDCTASFKQNDPWVALRCYNSGGFSNFDVNDLYSLGTTQRGTVSYVSDIANRLAHGWTN